MISIIGLDKAAVIAALYNASRPLGMGFMHYDATPMTAEEAAQYVGHHLDYLKGRVMKLKIGGDEFSELGYDRDNGQGAAARAVDALRQSADPNCGEIAKAHHDGKVTAAARTHQSMSEGVSVVASGNGITVLSVGLEDVADQLRPAVDAALKS